MNKTETSSLFHYTNLFYSLYGVYLLVLSFLQSWLFMRFPSYILLSSIITVMPRYLFVVTVISSRRPWCSFGFVVKTFEA